MALQTIVCAVCSASFEATRSDAETCSGRCRERRRKARTEARQVAQIERTSALLASLRAATSITPSD